MIAATPASPSTASSNRYVEALNHALAGIPADRVRYHLCWGSWHGPLTSATCSLRDIIDLMLSCGAGGYSFEAATPRHS